MTVAEKVLVEQSIVVCLLQYCGRVDPVQLQLYTCLPEVNIRWAAKVPTLRLVSGQMVCQVTIVTFHLKKVLEFLNNL